MKREQNPQMTETKKYSIRSGFLFTCNLLLWGGMSFVLTYFFCLFASYNKNFTRVEAAILLILIYLIGCFFLLRKPKKLRIPAASGIADDQNHSDTEARSARIKDLKMKCLTQAALLPIGSVFLVLFIAFANFGRKPIITNTISTARIIYNTTSAYQDELKESGNDWRFQTVILNIDENRVESPLHSAICELYPDFERYHYAILFDQNGKVVGALVSSQPLTENHLAQPQTLDQMRSNVLSLFDRQQLVGNYIVDIYPELDPNINTSDIFRDPQANH